MKTCEHCGEDEFQCGRLWPLGYGRFICAPCSITESIHASYEDANDEYYERYEEDTFS